MQGTRVLVVEDDFDVRDAVTHLLESEGYEVLQAANGQEALDVLRGTAARPNVIILDLMMPVMDGSAFRDNQRRDPELSSIPVVVMSADANAEGRAAAIGAHSGLRKPVTAEALLRALADAVRP